MELSDRIAAAALFVGILTLVATVVVAYIAGALSEKLSTNQKWEDLIKEYRQSDFGVAVKAVTDFYIDKCHRCLSNIRGEYIKQYETDFHNGDEKSPKETLHFYRRLLHQYYWQLWLCIESKGFKEEWIRDYFNVNEMNLIVIVYYMAQAASDESIYKPILVQGLGNRKDDGEVKGYLKELYDYFAVIFSEEKGCVLHFY